MENDLLVELLAAHADHLNLGGEQTETYLSMFPEQRETLAPLFYLATQLKAALAPAHPSLTFQEALLTALLESAQATSPAQPWWSKLGQWAHLPGRLVGLPAAIRLPHSPGRQMLVRAAAGGAGLAAAGVAAYVLHGRFSDRHSDINDLH